MDPNEQSVQDSDYTVIPRNLIFITNNDQVLLLKGSSTKRIWANKYNGIGGHIEPGETPLKSAHRELLEETGLVVQTLDLRAIVHIKMPLPPGIILFIFTGETRERTVFPSGEGMPEWIPKEQFLQLDLVEDLYTLLPELLRPGPMLYCTYLLDEHELHIKIEQSPNN
jgi:8-oxo-dGTP diphosphatase